MKIVERFQEVELQKTKEGEQQVLDRMAGRLFRAAYEGESLILRLVLDQGVQSQFSLTNP
jgi:hypothetical protein